MLSKPKLKQNDDPHDVLVVAPDVALVVPTVAQASTFSPGCSRHFMALA